jgi:hypothetical protein
MRIRRTVIVFLAALLAVPALAGSASAGGRPDPAPGWLGPTIVVALAVVGVIYASIVVFGIAYRRGRR